MNRIERIGLIVLASFSAIAVSGYWFFGLHPENLARFPSSATFYAHSFRFFAQTQVWLSGIVLFAILAYGRRWGWIPGLVAVYILSLASELAGTTTGFPFGDYAYTDLLGAKWFDHVPYLIPLSWFTMALPSFILVERTLSERFPKVVRWLIAAALLTSWDLVLDPAMSFLVPYWQWGQPGSFYGMPYINLAGWFVTGFVLSAALGQLKIAEAVDHVSSRTLLVYYAIVYALPAGMLVAAGHVLLVVLTTIGIFGSMYLVWRWSARRASESSKDGSDEPGSSTLDGRLATIADRTGRYFEQHSRSFSFASGFFLPSDRVRVCRLYALCRMSDDIADGTDLPETVREQMLAQWKAMVVASYRGQASGIDWLDHLMLDLKKGGLRVNVVEGLLDAVSSDILFRGIKTQDDLVDYSYGVASTVGIMMCHLFGETDPWKQERAVSLGLAMQLTNIQRDIGEDLRLGRVYLPTAWLEKYDVTVEDIRAMQAGAPLTEAWLQMMADLEGYAHLAYRKAWEAIPTLNWRFGPSVAVAADVYRDIHTAIQRNGGDSLTRRAYTSSPRKMVIMLGALARFLTGKWLLALQASAPESAVRLVRTALEKARLNWVVPFMLLLIHAAILAAF
ncbi:MAG: carotenoid biosynthesis protein [Bacteroidetes bacterium]|nr:carotenoid biosynthesis protein [Bacteroidota bacterium]MDA0874769.1 carotenoid biosynthesis protein [Bacteroidota bacterium]